MSHNTPNHGMRIAGQTVGTDRTGERCIEVMNPFTGQCIASVPKATLADVRQAFAIGHAYKARLSRYKRSAIVMDDADLDEAATLAVQGSYKNSGQRCTAVKRLLKQWRKVPSGSSATAAAASRTLAWATRKTRKACRKR